MIEMFLPNTYRTNSRRFQLLSLGGTMEKTYGVEGDSTEQDHKMAFKICNYSSSAFYCLQFLYACYTLYRVTCVNEKSKSMIACVCMTMYSSAALAILFAASGLDFYSSDDWTTAEEIYFIFCSELPNLFVFWAHWIIFYQYLELAVLLPILCKIGQYAQDASNKITSSRQCINATIIIVTAILIAHFVDKVFYTFKTSSSNADQSIAYFAVALKFSLMVVLLYIFYRLYKVVKSEPLLKLDSRMFGIHITAMVLYYFWWAAYEVAFIEWMTDPNETGSATTRKLRALAAIELLFNTFSVMLSVLLFYMIDKMTQPINKVFYDPLSKRPVPFFVFLTNVKLLQEHHGPDFQLSQVVRTSHNFAPRLTQSSTSEGGNEMMSPGSQSPLALSQTEDTPRISSPTNVSAIISPNSRNFSELNNAVANQSQHLMTSQQSLQRSQTTSQGTGLVRYQQSQRSRGTTVLDRELIRSVQTYNQISDDKKWNQKTIKLALQFMSLNVGYDPSDPEEGLDASAAINNTSAHQLYSPSAGRSSKHHSQRTSSLHFVASETEGGTSGHLSSEQISLVQKSQRQKCLSQKMSTEISREDVLTQIEQMEFSQVTTQNNTNNDLSQIQQQL